MYPLSCDMNKLLSLAWKMWFIFHFYTVTKVTWCCYIIRNHSIWTQHTLFFNSTILQEERTFPLREFMNPASWNWPKLTKIDQKYEHDFSYKQLDSGRVLVLWFSGLKVASHSLRNRWKLMKNYEMRWKLRSFLWLEILPLKVLIFLP